MDVAVIMTCYNRIEKTRHSLENLLNYQSACCGEITWDIYITDDGSSDGTQEMISGFSDRLKVTLLHGNGLFWDKGMHVAMSSAINKSHDFYLMLNDDVALKDDFWDVMIDSYKAVGGNCGISGATMDAGNAVTTYGGKKFKSADFVNPNGVVQEIDLANWNCFLVNQEVIDSVGIIDPNYAHSFGDYDYSMSMKRKGFNVFLAKDYIGHCDRNLLKGTFKDSELPRKKRIELFFSPKGMPFRSGIRYYTKNFDFLGALGMIKFLLAYFRNLFVVLVG